MDWGVIYITGKLLKLIWLKWARMTHLDIWNTSYGQKKGWESNWQFDFWPLKVGNHPDILAFRWRVTYHWKALDDGFNFVLNLISIQGLHAKLWAPKIAGVPVGRILWLPLRSPGTNAIWMWASWRGIEYTIRGRWWLHSSPGHGESCDFKLPMVRPNTKSVPIMH
jgi:hypothetical protein